MTETNSQNKSQVKIRTLEIDDIAPIFHLGEQLFASNLYPTLYRTWDQWEVTGAFNTDPDLCLVATVNQQFSGFLLGTLIEKNENIYGYVRWLGVSPDFHRMGIAKQLVDRFIERIIVEGADTVLMDTDPANEAAINFFTKTGFANPCEHVFLSLDLTKHDYYSKLLNYEQNRTEQLTEKLQRRR